MPTLLAVAKEPSYLLFAIALISCRLFDSAFGFFLSSIMYKMSDVSMLWARILSPHSFIACCGPSWKDILAFFPQSAYLLLLNPFQYIHEAGRGAIFGQVGFIPFWRCIGVLLSVTFFLIIFGRNRLKKRFDFF